MQDYFNVFTAKYAAMDGSFFDGMGTDARILHRSEDGTHLTVVSRYPKGIKGVPYGKDIDYFETFYVIRGTGRRTFADGAVIEINQGDAIFVQPGVDIAYTYDPGFIDIAFFWSDKKLPDFICGSVPYPPQD